MLVAEYCVLPHNCFHAPSSHYSICLFCYVSVKQYVGTATQVKVKLNLHGVVGVESVQQVDEEEYEEKVKRPIVKVPVLSMFLRIGSHLRACVQPALCRFVTGWLQHKNIVIAKYSHCNDWIVVVDWALCYKFAAAACRKQSPEACQTASRQTNPQRSRQMSQWMVMSPPTALQRCFTIAAHHSCRHVVLCGCRTQQPGCIRAKYMCMAPAHPCSLFDCRMLYVPASD